MNTTITIKELSRRLALRADDVCRQLLSNGHVEAGRWHVGGLDNSKGRSLHVQIEGDRAGQWCDEATGEHGDLIDLWREVYGLSVVDAIKDVRGYLGIPSMERTLRAGKSDTHRRTYNKPKPTSQYATPDTPGGKYLMSRGISERTLAAFKVGEANGVLEFRFADAEKNTHVHSKFLSLVRKNGKKEMRASANTRPILYGWQAIKNSDRRVIITEGEIDAMTLHSIGLPALSIPMGAGNKQGVWIEHEYDHLDRFDEVWIWMDNDEAGVAATNDIVQRLGTHRCLIVEWPDELPQGCDVNDLVCKHGWGVREIARAVMSAQYRAPEELASAGEFKAQVDELFDTDPSEQMLFPLPWARDGQLVDFRPGELSVWSGPGSNGKSLILGQMMLMSAARGCRALIASLEMKPADTLTKMVRQATALPSPEKPFRHEVLNWLDDKIWFFNLVGTAKVERLLEVSRYAVRRYGVEHIVIDSLMKLGVRDDDYSEQKVVVESLCDFANEMNVHVHLVTHFKKPSNGSAEDSGFNIKGSGGIRDLAHNVLLINRHKKKELILSDPNADEAEKDRARHWADAFLIIDKNRRHGWEGKISLSIDLPSLQFTPYKTPALPIYRRSENHA